jgi:signal transduction histidine kinase/ActR/RegA family two-component response regulator
LLDVMVKALAGGRIIDSEVWERGAQHGHARRLNGFTIEQLLREFTIFRKLVRETLEELVATEPAQNLYAARELLLDMADRSELGSIHQYLEETSRERDIAREALREANEQKDRFIAVLSHELRNPLAAIRTAVQILKESSFSETQRRRAFETIDRQSRYQVRLIDDLLDVNRISQGRIQLRIEKIDLRDPTRSAIDTYLPAIQAKAIRFQFIGSDRAVLADADSVRIEQIVSNLLNNALKFTSAEGSIDITLRREGARAIIAVRDSGTGLEASMLDRIFELFTQAQTVSGETGNGIGLWLAKNLAQMHRGTLTAMSDGPGHGTLLQLELPCLPDELSTSGEPKRRVLLVEDDPEQRELLEIALSSPELEIVTAKDGSEALTFTAQRPFDVCFIDLSLPDMSGYELLPRLLGTQQSKKPMTIALTGFGRPEDEARTRSMGFDHHVTKPADIELLRSFIQTHAQSSPEQ